MVVRLHFNKFIIFTVFLFSLILVLNINSVYANQVDFLDVPEFAKGSVLQSSTTSPNNSIHLNVIKGIFQENDTLQISGKANYLENSTINFKFFAPNGNVVAVADLPVSSDNTFEYSLNLKSPLRTQTGIYTILVSNGNSYADRYIWYDPGNNLRVSTDVLMVNNWKKIVEHCENENCKEVPRLWGPPGTSFTWLDVENEVVKVIIQEKIGDSLVAIYEEPSKSDIFSYKFDRPGEYVFYLETDHILSYLRIYMAGIVNIDENLGFASATLAYSSSTSILDSSSAIYDPGRSASVSIQPGSLIPGCEIIFDCFKPTSLVVDRGATVSWSNNDSASNTVTSGSPKKGPNGLFDSSLFLPGESFENTFDTTGHFEYFSMIHPWMVGSVTVLNPLFSIEYDSDGDSDSSDQTDEPADPEPTLEEEGEPTEPTIDKGEYAYVSVPQGTSVPGCEKSFDCYSPSDLVISQGTKVIWSNDDNAAHTVTAGSAIDGPTGHFDSSLFMSGTTFSHSFGSVGEFEYFCMVHPWMNGKITVVQNLPNDSSGGNEWDTRPTFGKSHETQNELIVENAFTFNDNQFTITDNHHTDFEQQSIIIGATNSFSAKVYADKKLKVQEFLFGIPNVGESHLAELGVEIWYGFDGEIEDVKIIQNSPVIDETSLVVTHDKTKCISSDKKPKCDTTKVSMTFLEPLKDNVMAIKAIDFKNRDQRTYLNDGFDISGESLNPMKTKMIPSSVKNEGLLNVTQLEKYSPFWVTEDGRTFEMNNFGSFKQVDQLFKRFQDSGEPKNRLHSGFGEIIHHEQDRAIEIFDSTKLISELPDSFGYHFEISERVDKEMKKEMLLQEDIAKEILDDYNVQARYSKHSK